MSRNLLHKDKLNEFRDYCVAHGWQPAKGEAPYPVLRLEHPERLHMLIVYTSDHPNREHLTVYGESECMTKRWMKAREST